MRYTCALDIADEYPDGITDRGVGLVLGVSERAVRGEAKAAQAKVGAKLREPVTGGSVSTVMSDRRQRAAGRW